MNAHAHQYVLATYQSLVDAILPPAEYSGHGTSYSPIDLKVHEYIIYGLDQYISTQLQIHQLVIPLAYPTATLLDAAAIQLVNAHLAQPLSHNQFPGGGMFSNLSRVDRIRTLSALENLHIDMYLLPSPFQNNAGMVKFVTDALNRFSMFGYYSEWPAYGSTRLNPPDYRNLEFFPPGWQQAGYPGVSLGYR